MPPSVDGPVKSTADIAIAVGLVLGMLYFIQQMVAPLFPALLWGLLLAAISAHPYERLASMLKGRRGLATLTFALLLVGILVLPAVLFAWELVRYLPRLEAGFASAAELAVSGGGSHPEFPRIAPFLDGLRKSLPQDGSEVFQGLITHSGPALRWMAAEFGTLGAFAANFAMGAIIALIILHRRFEVRAFLDRLTKRIGGEFAAGLLVRALEMTRSSVAGVFVSALSQTLLTALALILAGLPGIVLFMGFTFLSSLVQLGPLPVLVVAAGFLLAQGSYFAAVLLSAWMILVVMSADNLIRPAFAQRASEMPGAIALIASIGAFISWGLIGVFIGPVLMSVVYELAKAWMASTDVATARVL